MPSVYLGCSLTQAPPDFVAAVAGLKQNLRPAYEVLDFLGLTTGTAADVYRWDIERCVKDCDLFVAICDYPAIGLGYELAVAIEKLDKPVLALAHTDAHISRLLEGIPSKRYALKRYGNFSEIPDLIRQALAG